MLSPAPILLIALLLTSVAATPIACVPTEYSFSVLRPGAAVRDSGDGVWSLATTRGSDSAGDASAVFDSSIPPSFDTDLGTPGECVGGPGRGAGGRRGRLGANCLPLGKLLVAHGGDLTSLRQCSCVSPTCFECQPNDDARGAEFSFYFRKRVEFRHAIAVDLEGTESLVMTFPGGVTRVVPGLGDNSVTKVNIAHTFEAGETFSMRCSGSCGFAALAMTVCPGVPVLDPSPTPDVFNPEPSDAPCVLEDAPINFDNFGLGMPVRGGDGFTLKTRRFGPVARDDASAVFDSRKPTAFDNDLGAPNEKCGLGAGPGVGAGGVPGATGENCVPLGHLLIAHEGDLDRLRSTCASCPKCAECAPDDNVHGAEFEFTFTVPTTLKELVVLDVDEVPRSLIVTDHVGKESAYAGYGDNGKLTIPLNDAQVPAGGTLTIRCTGSCGIAHILRSRCISEPPHCPPKTVDFNSYATGARVSSGEDWILSTIRLGPWAIGDASAVFNTSMPTGGDTDLGAPNALCPVPGPGVGRGGRPESRGANCDPLGQVLIAHTGDLAALRSACAGCPRGIRCAGCEPNDHAGGASFRFTFGRAVRLGRLVIMDLDDAARSASVEMPSEKIFMTGLGDNSVQTVGLGLRTVAAGQSMTISCASSCAIVKFEYYPCV